MQNLPLSALIDRLEAERHVWLRLAASRPEDDWRLTALEVTIGDCPPTWRRQRWFYPRAAFIASTPAGKTVAGWLTRGRISLRPLALRVDLSNSVHVERRYARFDGVFEALPWSTREWRVNVQGDESNHPLHDELVASDAPAFFNFDLAAAAFFGLPPATNRSFSGRELMVREQDQRARIDSVYVRPTEVVVTVSGCELTGTYLTLGGDGSPRKRLSQRTCQVQLPAPSGLAPAAWLALHRGHELLDRRILDRSWGGKDFEVEVDASTRVEVLISGGERGNVEFKQQLPGSDPRKVMKTVAAFANGVGGNLVFGIEDEDNAIVGLGDACSHRSMDRLTNLITDWVHPLPDFHIEMAEINGHGLITLKVAPGTDTPYGVGTDTRDMRYYIRRAASTFPAMPYDIQAVVRSRMPKDELRFPATRRRL
jgi:hypothetical protein